MPAVTRFLIERDGQLVKDKQGSYLMFVEKAEADAVDRRLNAIELLAELMAELKLKGIEYDQAYQLAEGLVDQAEQVQEAIKPVVADNKKRQK